ncbi:MAG: hypothetical protein M1817_005634 [Caeruleum heppii]|nr:MAG: hypothetical protein M1817_005634 [Caeruleum heppii]
MSNLAAEEAAALFAHSDTLKSHPEDAQSATSSEPDSDSSNTPDVSDNMPGRTIAPSSNFHIPRGTSFDANTGPKGVISDALSFQRARRQKWQRKQQQQGGPFTADGSGDLARTELSPHRRHGRSQSPQDPEDLDEDNDEEFMDRWRNSRLRELKTGSVKSRRMSPSMRVYGTVQRVDAVGYLDAVEKVGRETVVVVCIYDDQSEVSQQVEDCLVSLAQKQSTTRFVKLHFEEAEMDVASVPAILAYRAGELFANLVAIIDEIPPDRALSSSSLEAVLKKHAVFE